MSNSDVKKGFVVYLDIREQVEDLNMEQRGKLFTAMLAYGAGEDVPEMDPVTRMAFKFISAQMRRDAEKYERTCERRREAGEKGGRPKAKKANGFSENQNNQKVFLKPDTETDKETDKETETDKEKDKETDTKARAAFAAISATPKPGQARGKKTKFNNFPERVYDIEVLEKLLQYGG